MKINLNLYLEGERDREVQYTFENIYLDMFIFMIPKIEQKFYACKRISFLYNFLLFFADPPIIKKNPLTEKSAADPGETARLTCEARGVPNITFYWGRVGGQRLTEGPKYEMNARMIDLLTWRAEFLIYNVTSLDYGGYECIARNSEGTTRFTIDLDVKSRPGKHNNMIIII